MGKATTVVYASFRFFKSCGAAQEDKPSEGRHAMPKP